MNISKAIVRAMRALLVAFAGFSVCIAADWPAFRGNLARTGYYPDPVGCPSGAPAWKLSLGCEIISSPAVSGNMLYIGARDSCLYAIDCGSGAVRWKKKTGGWVDASPLINEDRVIVGSRDSAIYLFDKRSGDISGIVRAGTQLSSPATTASGTLIAGWGIPGGGICAYGSGTLAKRLASPEWSIPLPQFTYSSPAVYGQAVVIGATDGKLYGIDASNRDTMWSLQTGGIIYLSTPAIDDTIVYFAPGDEDRGIYAVSLLTGRMIWKSETGAPGVDTTRALAKSRLSKRLTSSDLVELLRMSPEMRKKTIVRLRRQGIELPRVPQPQRLGKKTAASGRQFIPLDGMKSSSVGVGQTNVYVIQKDLGYVLTNDSLADYQQQFTIQALDKYTGAQAWNFSEWRKSPSLGYCSSPVVTENMVFFGWGEGRIYGLDAHTGEKLWQDSLQGHIVSSPAIAGTRLYVATMEGQMYAYDLTNGPPGLDFRKSTYCYPNPARSRIAHIQVYVNDPAECVITCYNAAEKPVFRASRTLAAGEKYAYDWDLSTVANGAYIAIVKVTYASGKTDKKVLKIGVLR